MTHTVSAHYINKGVNKGLLCCSTRHILRPSDLLLVISNGLEVRSVLIGGGNEGIKICRGTYLGSAVEAKAHFVLFVLFLLPLLQYN